jgi:hypothetical protein
MSEEIEVIMPIQPIIDGRFVPNKIVQVLLDSSKLDLNDIARLDFTEQERTQFAQLIGYSLSGFSELSYVDDETYEAACRVNNPEAVARNLILRDQLNEAREGVKRAAVALFRIHPDDLK